MLAVRLDAAVEVGRLVVEINEDDEDDACDILVRSDATSASVCTMLMASPSSSGARQSSADHQLSSAAWLWYDDNDDEDDDEDEKDEEKDEEEVRGLLTRPDVPPLPLLADVRLCLPGFCRLLDVDDNLDVDVDNANEADDADVDKFEVMTGGRPAICAARSISVSVSAVFCSNRVDDDDNDDNDDDDLGGASG